MRISRTGNGATARIDDLTRVTALRLQIRQRGHGAMAFNPDQGVTGRTLRLAKRGGSGSKATVKDVARRTD
jgi:hypothetical protein